MHRKIEIKVKNTQAILDILMFPISPYALLTYILFLAKESRVLDISWYVVGVPALIGILVNIAYSWKMHQHTQLVIKDLMEKIRKDPKFLDRENDSETSP